MSVPSAKAQATATRCRIPAEQNPTGRSSRRLISRLSVMDGGSVAGTFREPAAIARTSLTRSDGGSISADGAKPMARARAGRSAVRSTSPTRQSPESIGSLPAIARSRLVLPEPFAPISPCQRPALKRAETPAMARTRPRDTRRSRTATFAFKGSATTHLPIAARAAAPPPRPRAAAIWVRTSPSAPGRLRPPPAERPRFASSGRDTDRSS